MMARRRSYLRSVGSFGHALPVENFRLIMEIKKRTIIRKRKMCSMPLFYRKEPGNAVSTGSIYENLWQFQVF